jgi:hypothetical protein
MVSKFTGLFPKSLWVIITFSQTEYAGIMFACQGLFPQNAALHSYHEYLVFPFTENCSPFMFHFSTLRLLDSFTVPFVLVFG